jgi:hypothetical protein
MLLSKRSYFLLITLERQRGKVIAKNFCNSAIYSKKVNNKLTLDKRLSRIRDGRENGKIWKL